MKAFVTGSNGLIGSNLVKTLLKQGHSVRAFVRETSDLRSLDGVLVDKYFGDILEIETLKKAMSGSDTVFHVASIFSYSIKSDEIINIAIAGTINVLEAAKEAGVKKVILTSSSVIFGSTFNQTILDEENKAICNEEAPYVTAKILQEQEGFKRAAELGIDMVAVCPTICIGPNDCNLSESNRIIVNYLKDPFRTTWPGGCNIVSVYDVVDGHILAAEKGIPGKCYLLGSENLQWYEIHQTISEMCGVEGPFITSSCALAYLTATVHEVIGFFTNNKPVVSRVQAKMVGLYYWYSHNQAHEIGYSPKMNAREALANTISWLVKSRHISNGLRNALTLSTEIYNHR